MTPPDAAPSRRARLAVALAIGVVSAAFCYANLVTGQDAPGAQPFAEDFTIQHYAARILLGGGDPYPLIGPAPYAFNYPYLYPLPAGVFAVLFAWLPMLPAAAAFAGLGAALLAWAVTRDGWDRLPLFLSVPFLLALTQVQWAPWLAAAALVPTLGVVFAAKPTVGLAAFLYRPTWRAALAAAALGVVALALVPRWPLEWLALVRHGTPHAVPLLSPWGGPLVALALLRWRRPEARLLAALACVPQFPWFYDQLLLWLVPRTRRESLALSVLSAVAFALWLLRLAPGTPATTAVQDAWPYVLTLLYLPCLVMVLRRPNEGAVPVAPAWLPWGTRARHGPQVAAIADSMD